MELELGEILDAKKEEGDTYMAEIEVSLQNFRTVNFVLRIIYLTLLKSTLPFSFLSTRVWLFVQVFDF